MSFHSKVISRQRIALIITILIILLFPMGLHLIRSDNSQSTTPITQQWVDQQLSVWKPSQNSSVGFGVVFQPASYDNILKSYNTPQVQNADLNMLFETGATCVRIDIGFDAWLNNVTSAKEEMSSLIAQIRSDGKCLIIADAAAESYRKNSLPWSQFMQAWVQRVRTLAALYHPDYYIVIKEPGWYVPMVSDAATNPSFQDPNSWLNLTQNLASAVLSVSPNTKVGVAVAADSLSANPSLYNSFLTGIGELSNVSFIGFDIYTQSGFENTQNFLDQYSNIGKNVWIAECWSGGGSGIFDSTRSSLDTSWIQLVYYFSQLIHAQMIIPFYTDIFASYSFSSTSPTDSSQILSLLQQRTQVFYEFQNLATSYGSISSSSTSSSTHNSSSTSQSISTTTSSQSSTFTSNSVTSFSSSTQHSKFPIKELSVIAVILIIVIVGLIVVSRKRR